MESSFVLRMQVLSSPQLLEDEKCMLFLSKKLRVVLPALYGEFICYLRFTVSVELFRAVNIGDPFTDLLEFSLRCARFICLFLDAAAHQFNFYPLKYFMCTMVTFLYTVLLFIDI